MNTNFIRKILSDFDNRKYRKITDNQQNEIYKKYKIYTNFYYYIDGEKLSIYMNKETFKRMEYYLNLRGEKILTRIEDGEILIVYETSSKINEIIDLLQGK